MCEKATHKEQKGPSLVWRAQKTNTPTVITNSQDDCTAQGITLKVCRKQHGYDLKT